MEQIIETLSLLKGKKKFSAYHFRLCNGLTTRELIFVLTDKKPLLTVVTLFDA